MKSKKWTSVVVRTLFAALAMPVSLVMTPVPVSAQQRSSHRSDLSTWTGASRMSQSSQTLRQTPNGNNEGKNHDARYKVVPIPVLPGKTNTVLGDGQLSVNNSGDVTGYSFVYSGDYHSIYLTAQGFIWHHGRLNPLPLLSGYPGAFAGSINDLGQVAVRPAYSIAMAKSGKPPYGGTTDSPQTSVP